MSFQVERCYPIANQPLARCSLIKASISSRHSPLTPLLVSTSNSYDRPSTLMLTGRPSTGSSFDSHWHFGAFVMKEIKASLAKTNAVRARQHFSPYPPITANFLLSGFKSDSRFNGSLLRRGYKPLSEHIKEHPDLPAFHRPLHIPVPCKFFLRL